MGFFLNKQWTTLENTFFFFVKPRTILLKMKRLDPIVNERKHYNFKGEEFAYRDLHT